MTPNFSFTFAINGSIARQNRNELRGSPYGTPALAVISSNLP